MVSVNNALRNRPLSVSRHYFSFPRWFKFERAVDALVAKQIYFMDLEQLLSVIRQVCRIEDEEEVTTMLDFYHDLGVIVKHGRTVVLQAQWLIDLFKQLITVTPFDEAVSVPDYSCISIYCLPEDDFPLSKRKIMPKILTCRSVTRETWIKLQVFPLGGQTCGLPSSVALGESLRNAFKLTSGLNS